MAKKCAVESKIRYRISLYLDVPEEAKIHGYLDSIENDLLLRGIELRRMLRAGYRALVAKEGDKGLLANTNRASSLDDDDDNVLPSTPRTATKPRKVAPPAPKTVLAEKPEVQIDIEEVIAATEPAPSTLPEKAELVAEEAVQAAPVEEPIQAAAPDRQTAEPSDEPLARLQLLMESQDDADSD